MLSNHITSLLEKQNLFKPTHCLDEPHLPLPSMPQVVVDIRSLYDMWVYSWKDLFQKHTSYYKKCQWTKCFNKKDAGINSKRWHMYKDFLYFIDTLDQNDKNKTYNVMELHRLQLK
jgi:hypothetical protein